MSKAEDKKQIKRTTLLNTAFDLFTTKGLHNTSISDIVEKAGVAKGTFYLYFKDKYDINTKLVAHKTARLFDSAMEKMALEDLPNLKSKILFLTSDLIDALSSNKTLLLFVSKNLGLGFFRYAANSENPDTQRFQEAYRTLLSLHGSEVHNPEIMLYMIIELLGGCCYSSILYNDPVSIEELKPYLLNTIGNIIDDFSNT